MQDTINFSAVFLWIINIDHRLKETSKKFPVVFSLSSTYLDDSGLSERSGPGAPRFMCVPLCSRRGRM